MRTKKWLPLLTIKIHLRINIGILPFQISNNKIFLTKARTLRVRAWKRVYHSKKCKALLVVNNIMTSSKHQLESLISIKWAICLHDLLLRKRLLLKTLIWMHRACLKSGRNRDGTISSAVEKSILRVILLLKAFCSRNICSTFTFYKERH